MLRSSAQGHSPKAKKMLAKSLLYHALCAYVLSAVMTSPSVNKLPNLRNMNVPSASTAHKALFQGAGHEDQIGQDLPKGLDADSTLPIDGAALKYPSPSTDPIVFYSSSHIIKKVEIASGKVETLPLL